MPNKTSNSSSKNQKDPLTKPQKTRIMLEALKERQQKQTQRSVDENGLPRKRPGKRGGKG